MIPMSTDLVERKTATMLAGVYLQAETEIREAYRLLEQAKKRLGDAFLDSGWYFDPNPRDSNRVGTEGADYALQKMKINAWQVIINRMGIKQLLSVERRNKLDRQLQTGEGLPEISGSAIIEMLEATAGNLPNYMEEAVLEVFDYLRPRNSAYKTNSEFEIGKRVVLTWIVEAGWCGRAFRVLYNRDCYLNAIDNVFHLLDGKGVVKSHYGPLYQAIEESKDGTGQTDYFKFRACKNGNLHLEFLRLDLLARFNAIAGGARLKKDQGQ